MKSLPGATICKAPAERIPLECLRSRFPAVHRNYTHLFAGSEAERFLALCVNPVMGGTTIAGGKCDAHQGKQVLVRRRLVGRHHGRHQPWRDSDEPLHPRWIGDRSRIHVRPGSNQAEGGSRPRKLLGSYLPATTGNRSIALRPARLRHVMSLSSTASASLGQRLNSDFSAHLPSIRAS